MKILAEALSPTIPPTNSASPRASPIPFKDHAKIRIVTAGTINLKPSARLSINPLNVTTFLGRYKINIKNTVTSVAKIKLVSASHPEKAVIRFVAPPWNPV